MKYSVITVLASVMLFSTPSFAEDSFWTRAGNIYDLEPRLLYAVALRESRRTWKDGLARPWPWTISSKHGSRFYDTKEEAVAELKYLTEVEGLTNIDIGLMQINLHYNGDHVEDPADLLDPQINLLTGARVLRAAIDTKEGGLAYRVGRYNTSDKIRATEYGTWVLGVKNELSHVFK